MATWLVEYCPLLISDPDHPDAEREIPCFRVYAEDNPERWIVATNPDLPLAVQEHTAFLLAEFLSDMMGV